MNTLAARMFACFVLLALAASACGGGSDGTAAAPAVDLTEPLPTTTPVVDTTELDDDQAPEPTATPAPTSTEVPQPTATPEPTPSPEPTRQFWADVLAPGDCFNQSDIEPGGLPTPISCDEQHEQEIIAVGALPDGPDAPWPGEDAVFSAADDALCIDAVPAFAGVDGSVLPYDILVFYPTEDEWNDGDRGIMCSAASREADRKIGTAAAAGQTTDDVLLYRVSLSHPDVGEFEDWVVASQFTALDELTSITDGTIDLQLRRPALLDGGFTFYANDLGTDTIPTSRYTFEWDDPSVTIDDAPLPDFEFSGIATRGNALAFAARETADADWNLFSITPGESHILGDDDSDERFASFTPDGQRIVFQRDGDLWITDVDGANQQQLTDTDANEWESAVSPDGELIAFASDRTGNDDIWVMSIDGGEAVNVTDHPADDIWPSWSADGSRLYFATDRLDPIDDRTVLMFADGDGNQSFFSSAQGNHAQPIEAADAAIAFATFPTLDERYNGAAAGETLEGEPGSSVFWSHSTRRLDAALPAGWQVEEYDDELAAFVAAVDIAEADSDWASDAVYVTLATAPTVDEFMANHFDTALANETCDAVDGIPLTEGDDQIWIQGQVNDCGGATGRVAALYDASTGLGVLVEGQSDNLPDAATDEALLTEILTSIAWR